VDNSENICLPPWITVVNIWYSPQMINYTYNGSSYTNYMGNYWDDYNGTDADNDGLGDTPYGINGDNKDFFPLIASFENYQPMSISEVHRVHNLDTEEDFLTIQGTIDDPDTRDGHVIEVEDGFYPENVKVTKSLTIRSENGSANCIVQAAGSDPAFNVTADYVNISGFTVKGGTDWFNAGIHLLNSSCCNISNNDCSNNFNFRGIFLSYSNNNSISNNNCLNRINGIRLEYSNNNTISNNNCTEFIQLKNSNNNIISYNDCWISLLSNSSNNTISNNNCTNNGRCTGISLGEYSSDNIISDNNCSSNGNGITLGPHSNNNSISSNNCSSNNDDGIRLMDSNTNTISNNDCSNNGMETGGRGITLWDSSNNFIAGNKVSFNGWYGIILKFDAKLSYPSNNKIIGNYISNTGRLLKPPLASGNAAGIYLTGSNDSIINNTFVNDGLYVERPTQNEVRENTVNGKPLVYLENESDREIKGAGQVILLNCDNITVENSDLSHTFIGVYLQKTNNCKIRGNNICSNIYGIYLSDSSNNKISNNNISSNSHEGIHFFFSPNNTICNNNVLNNRRYGVYLLISTSNRIYLNNFVNNSNNVSSSAKNIWNSSEKITYIYNESTYSNYLGNYWDDYTGSDTDNDGIGDIPYSTDSDNDIYPLMSPFEYYWLSLV
jgi:parallel beta-helix repeat protein